MGTLVCRAELNKKEGLILTVENGDDGITQTIVMDGTSITTTVAGSSQTSTITQHQDSIAIACKTFTLDAETITCNSTQATSHESGMDFKIKSGKDLNVSATAKGAYSATNSTMESTAKTEIKGNMLNMDGTVSAELKGGSIKLSATGIMDLIASGIATLKGSVVNISSIIKLG